MTAPAKTLELRSLIKSTGDLEVSLVEVEVQAPADDEVTVRVEASPINPSDLGLLFSAADPKTFQAAGTPARPVLTGKIPDALMRSMAGRVDKPLPVGNVGAGVVVAAGKSPAAQALLGKT